jgi:hypothetical protein
VLQPSKSPAATALAAASMATAKKTAWPIILLEVCSTRWSDRLDGLDSTSAVCGGESSKCFSIA